MLNTTSCSARNCGENVTVTISRSLTQQATQANGIVNSNAAIRDEYSYAMEMSQDFVSIVAPFIMITGVIGNILLYFVFPKCSFAARLETRLYIRALAITDIVVMIGLLRKWLHALKNLDFATSSVVACKATNMICYVATHFAVWLVVAITAERCQTILWPRKPTANRYRHHVAVLFVLAFISIALNVHHVFDTTVVLEVHDEFGGVRYFDWDEYHNQKLDPSRTLSYCSMDRKASNDLAFSLWTVVDAVAYTVVPSLLIIVMNILIVIRLIRVARYAKHNAFIGRLSLTASGFNTIRSQQCRALAPTQATVVHSQLNGSGNGIGIGIGIGTADHVTPLIHAAPRDRRNSPDADNISHSRVSETESETGNRIVHREREVTMMLLIFSIVFVVLTAPFCIVTAMSNMKYIIEGLSSNGTWLLDDEYVEALTSSSEGSAVEPWVQNVTEMLMYAQHACQFYLYLCGRNFRKLVGYALCAPPAISSYEANELGDVSRRRRRLSDLDDDLFADLNNMQKNICKQRINSQAHDGTVTSSRRSSIENRYSLVTYPVECNLPCLPQNINNNMLADANACEKIQEDSGSNNAAAVLLTS